MTEASPVPFILALLLAPLMMGIINRTKAVIAGRNGPPLLQLYFDLWRLLHKGAVYSETTTWLFRAGPAVGLAALLTALLMTPLGGVPAAVSFTGDIVAIILLLGMARFMLMLAALDTGSAFEGMGASREAAFSALTEPGFFLSLAALAHFSGSSSLTGCLAAIGGSAWITTGPAFALLAITLLGVFLAENARIPVDDPNTHLELTMIHEVMVLDHSGPDLAIIEYTATLRHWLIGSVIAGIVVPVRTGSLIADAGASIAGVVALAIAVGLIESTMARLRLKRVPQLLVGAAALAIVAIVVMGA